MESPDSRSKFRAYVKKVTREFHFARDCKAFENTKQGGTFKTVLLPILKQTLPYSGIAINKAVFKGSDRRRRTVLLQVLSGVHFATEYYCTSFKKSRSSKCPFCDCETRNLKHYISECSFFGDQRNSLVLDLTEMWKSMSIPSDNFLDIPFLLGKPLPTTTPALRAAARKNHVATSIRFSKFLTQLADTLNPPTNPNYNPNPLH